MSSSPNTRRSRAQAVWGYTGAAVALLAVCYYVARMWSDPGNFEIFYLTGQRVLAGEPVYQADWDPYVYAPFFAIFLSWFAHLSFSTAKTIWLLLQTASILAACLAVKATIERRWSRPLPRGLWWLVFIAAFQALELNMLHLQVNALVFLGALGGLLLLHDRRVISGSLLLSLVATLKLTMFIFLPYFVVRGEWRKALGVAAGSLFWLLIPALQFGWRENLTLLVGWRENVARLARNGEYVNDSLAGFLYRHLTATPSRRSGTFLNLLEWNPDYVAIVHVLLSLALLACVLVWVFRRRASSGFDTVVVEWAMLFAVTLIVSPTSWKHHYIPLLLIYAVLLALPGSRGAGLRTARVSAALAFTLITLSTTTLWGAGPAFWAHVVGLPVWGLVLLVVALWWVELRAADAPGSGSELARAPASP